MPQAPAADWPLRSAALLVCLICCDTLFGTEQLVVYPSDHGILPTWRVSPDNLATWRRQ